MFILLEAVLNIKTLRDSILLAFTSQQRLMRGRISNSGMDDNDLIMLMASFINMITLDESLSEQDCDCLWSAVLEFSSQGPNTVATLARRISPEFREEVASASLECADHVAFLICIQKLKRRIRMEELCRLALICKNNHLTEKDFVALIEETSPKQKDRALVIYNNCLHGIAPN